MQAEPLLTGELPAVPAEGTLLPETYHFPRGDTRADDGRADAQGDAAGRSTRSGPSAGPACRSHAARTLSTLASIVEKETAVPTSAPMVASVFLNRLQAACSCSPTRR